MDHDFPQPFQTQLQTELIVSDSLPSLYPPIWYLLALGLLLGLSALGRRILPAQWRGLACGVLAVYLVVLTSAAAITDPGGSGATLWIIYVPVLVLGVGLACWAARNALIALATAKSETERLREIAAQVSEQREESMTVPDRDPAELAKPDQHP